MSVAVLFPGQGSQEKNMGRDVAESRTEAMDLWVLAEKESGLPLREIYWGGTDADMSDTRALQPALTAADLCLWLAARDRIAPLAAAGHSLGEFPALAAAGVLSMEDALRAVSVRGKLMAGAGREGQGMAAVVKLDRAAVEEIVAAAASDTGKELRVANYNSPAQFVISGEKPALDRAADLAKERKGRAIPLAVSGAFHSPLIGEAASEFAAYLGRLGWNTPKFPVFFNATGAAEADPGKILALMRGQMTSSVRWTEIMQGLYAAGARRFCELGPKGVLAKLAGANLPDAADAEAVSVPGLEQAEAL